MSQRCVCHNWSDPSAVADKSPTRIGADGYINLKYFPRTPQLLVFDHNQRKRNAMRYVIFVLLLSSGYDSAFGAWVSVPNGDASTFYADPATIQKSGNVVKMVILLDYKSAQLRDTLDERNRSYKSIRSISEFNCKETSWRRQSFTQHAGEMGRGETVNSNQDVGKWESAPIASAAGAMWKIACAKR